MYRNKAFEPIDKEIKFFLYPKHTRKIVTIWDSSPRDPEKKPSHIPDLDQSRDQKSTDTHI
jgi:hypothetical protein